MSSEASKDRAYESLTAFVNKQLQTKGLKAIDFELYENLTESIYAFPRERLLSIESERAFIIEAYYKIADWSIETPLLDDLLGQLERGDRDREGVIALFESSEEKRLKHTCITSNTLGSAALAPPNTSHHPSLPYGEAKAVTSDEFAPNEPILFVEISSYIASRAYSGIQRVVREFAQNLVNDALSIEYKFIYFDVKLRSFIILPREEMLLFLQSPREYVFEDVSNLMEIEEIGEGDLFLDMDAVWSLGLKRAYLYPKLKSNGVHILNFIHDMIPIIRPYATHHDIVRNFASFIDAVYSYSDMVFFNSRSSQRDFEEVKEQIGVQRHIPTLVTKLGSSLFSVSTKNKNDRGLVLQNQPTKWVDFQHLTSAMEASAPTKASTVTDWGQVSNVSFRFAPQNAPFDWGQVSNVSFRFASQNIQHQTPRYILFVGTIEPRKNQALMLEVFEELHQSYDDLHLVFIGIAGWSNDAFIKKLSSHPLLGERLHWYEYVDDGSLVRFYESAFMVVYLSSYEGFGLPIAESLSYGNITITSKNSSIYEVGKDFADYILYDTPNELSSIITIYLDMPKLYNLKRDYIKNHYQPYSWESMYSSISNAIEGYISYQPISTPSKIQYVTVSYALEPLQRAIATIDRESSIVDSYLIITSVELVESFKSIESLYDVEVLGIESGAKWDILISLLNTRGQVLQNQPTKWVDFQYLTPKLQEKFVLFEESYNGMIGRGLELQNQPTKWVDFQYLTPNGRYRAYHFYDLLEWHSQQSHYDKTLHFTKSILDEKSTELLAYSSDIPQIIDRHILSEIAQDTTVSDSSLIDVQSYYFNRAISLYPYLFEKISLHKEQSSLSQRHKEEYKKYNLIHRVVKFIEGDALLLCTNIPYLIDLNTQSHIRIVLGYKAVGFEVQSLFIVARIGRQTISSSKLKTDSYYIEGIVELEISSKSLKLDESNVTIDLLVDERYIYGKDSPYMVKIIKSTYRE